MAKIGLIVPVYKNFEGFTELMKSVDVAVQPFVIPNWKYNHGVSVGWNIGLEQSIYYSCDYALVCNDDIILDPDTIRKLQYALAWEDYDLITAVNTRDVDVTDSKGYADAPDFACFMVKPQEFLDAYGSFDEEFTPAYFEDNDMHYRLKLAGAKVGCRTDAGMFHKGSVTQNWNGQQVVTGDMFERNRSYYARKWGGTPGNEQYTTPFNGENN